MSNRQEAKGTPQEIPTDLIDRNPENPRIIFSEMREQDLLNSINDEGILVPLTVYPDGPRYTLLDGDRRLRCARRLNLKVVPVNIIRKPTPVENILQMFHIHNVRRSWELIETAKKLEVLLKSSAFEGKNNQQIAKLTGLSPSTVKRCKDLLSLPPQFTRMILDTYDRIAHGETVDDKRKLTEDFFLESKLALNSIKKNLPEVYAKYGEETLLKKLVLKRRSGTFSNVLQVGHLIPKIALSAKKGASRETVATVIRKIVEDPDYTIREAYDSVAGPIFSAASIEKKCVSLITDLRGLAGLKKIPPEQQRESLAGTLKKLREAIDESLRRLR